MIKKIILFFCFLFLIPTVNCETIIYDTITVSEYKIIKLSDDLNYKYLNDYKYTVYVNDSFYGEFTKDEKIHIQDGSDVKIFIPSTISTDISKSFSNIESLLSIFIGGFISIGFILILFYYLIKKVKR